MLYQKYRSQRFSGLIGQDAVSKTLSNAVARNLVGHAYIFSGPRGTGKTSTARILAKAVNCLNPDKNGEPCNNCEACNQITEGRAVDVIEIDAASHTSVDDIRDLIEKIEFSPVSLRKKVYIIDEVHMLSKSAFNALLKTLEEPPSHVLFILATTEIHKIPITILSRCQRFDFNLATEDQIISVLKNIIIGEDLKIEDEALKHIARVAQGSYRDSITIFERVLSTRTIVSDSVITATEIQKFLGIPDEQQSILLLDALLDKDIKEALKIIDESADSGINMKIFSAYFLEFLRKSLIDDIKKDLSNDRISEKFKILKEFGTADRLISSSSISQLPLEMAVLEISKAFEVSTLKSTSNKMEVGASSYNKSFKINKKDIIVKKKTNDNSPDIANDTKITLTDIESKWEDFVNAIRPYNGQLLAFISKSKVSSIRENRLNLLTTCDFFKGIIEDEKSQNILLKISEEVFGVPLIIKCQIEEKGNEDTVGSSDEKNVVGDAMDVFDTNVV